MPSIRERHNQLRQELGRLTPDQVEVLTELLTWVRRRLVDVEDISDAPAREWAQPAGAHDAYIEGERVIHDGQVWESTTDANVWRPGVSGWQPAPEGDQPAAWIQPTGAHDAYDQGDRVTHNGAVWESNVNGNTWEPPTQWTEV